jgi:hypothetical protein
MSCIRLLAPQDGKRLIRLRLLRGYVTVLVLINIIFGVENFLWANYFSIFEDQIGDSVQLAHTFATMQLICTLTIAMVGALTDGLLVSILLGVTGVKEYGSDYGTVTRCGAVIWYNESLCFLFLASFEHFAGYFQHASG